MSNFNNNNNCNNCRCNDNNDNRNNRRCDDNNDNRNNRRCDDNNDNRNKDCNCNGNNDNHDNKSELMFARSLIRDLVSELEAISEYTYGSVILQECNNGISELFDSIAKDEMHHFRLLSVLIRNLGGNPSLNTSLRTKRNDTIGFNEGCRCNRASRRRITDSIRDEIAANERYTWLAASAPNREAAQILRNIASDEAEHIKRLQAALSGIPEEQ